MKTLLFTFTTLICFSFSSETTILSTLSEKFTGLTITDIQKMESTHGGKLQEFNGITVNIGSDYYPNKKGYNMQSAIIYETKNNKGIKRKGEYFHSDDSILRATIYNYFANKDLAKLKGQFKILEEEMTDLLGSPDKTVNSKEVQKNWFQTSCTWSTNDKVHAYLTLTGSNQARPHRLRMIIYKD
jgi:hypothetical protein